MLRIKDRHERDMLYGPTNEEMITDIFRTYVKSYKDLPLNLYHIQWKFRDEVRPRFGVMRGREFLMKDAYSFDLDEGARARLQPHVRRLSAHLRPHGPEAIPMRADTGPIGGDMSHEFIILADTGESAGVLRQATWSTSDVPGDREIDFDNDVTCGDRQAVDLALCRDRRDARRGAFEAIAEGRTPFGARHRGRPYLLFRHQVFRSR
jgi:prolyl-tRNA synthetase